MHNRWRNVRYLHRGAGTFYSGVARIEHLAGVGVAVRLRASTAFVSYEVGAWTHYELGRAWRSQGRDRSLLG